MHDEKQMAFTMARQENEICVTLQPQIVEYCILIIKKLRKYHVSNYFILSRQCPASVYSCNLHNKYHNDDNDKENVLPSHLKLKITIKMCFNDTK